MKKRILSAVCALLITISAASTAFAASYRIDLTPEQAGSEVATPLNIPAQTPKGSGETADMIQITAPVAHAAISIPINGSADSAEVLMVDANGIYSIPEDTFAVGSHLYTMLPGTSANLIVLKKMPFSDVPRKTWYYSACFWAYHNGLMSGSSATTFVPTAAATRAQLVTILWRDAGKPAHSGSVSFADVPAGMYYTDAVLWAAENGIVSPSENFNSNGSMERQQLSAMLYRYAAYRGLDTSARADLSAYADSGSIAPWAKDAMAWTAAEGLITGDNKKQLLPSGTANRAQLATILMRLFGSDV